jgi:asparagine synthase (glutamine-hydrolysing)
MEPARTKLELLRRLNPRLANVTYERTKVKPSRPYPLHVAGFVGNVGYGRLSGKPTYGTGQLADFWVRDTETELHEFVTSLVDDARDRDLFDGNAVQDLYDAQMSGKNEIPLLASVTTLEYWMQRHLE